MSAFTAARAIELTDSSGCTHLVAEECFTVGRRAGRYVTLCKDLVLSASLTAKESELCCRCVRSTTRD